MTRGSSEFWNDEISSLSENILENAFSAIV